MREQCETTRKKRTEILRKQISSTREGAVLRESGNTQTSKRTRSTERGVVLTPSGITGATKREHVQCRKTEEACGESIETVLEQQTHARYRSATHTVRNKTEARRQKSGNGTKAAYMNREGAEFVLTIT